MSAGIDYSAMGREVESLLYYRWWYSFLHKYFYFSVRAVEIFLPAHTHWRAAQKVEKTKNECDEACLRTRGTHKGVNDKKSSLTTACAGDQKEGKDERDESPGHWVARCGGPMKE